MMMQTRCTDKHVDISPAVGGCDQQVSHLPKFVALCHRWLAILSHALCHSTLSYGFCHAICRSFEPPKRDEEKEVERKARAKRARETRRSTQVRLPVVKRWHVCTVSTNCRQLWSSGERTGNCTGSFLFLTQKYTCGSLMSMRNF